MSSEALRWSTELDPIDVHYVNFLPLPILTSRTLNGTDKLMLAMYYYQATIDQHRFDDKGLDQGIISLNDLADALSIHRNNASKSRKRLLATGLLLRHDTKGHFRLHDNRKLSYLHLLMLWPARFAKESIKENVVKLMSKYDELHDYIPAFLDPQGEPPHQSELWDRAGLISTWHQRFQLENRPEKTRLRLVE